MTQFSNAKAPLLAFTYCLVFTLAFIPPILFWAATTASPHSTQSTIIPTMPAALYLIGATRLPIPILTFLTMLTIPTVLYVHALLILEHCSTSGIRAIPSRQGTHAFITLLWALPCALISNHYGMTDPITDLFTAIVAIAAIGMLWTILKTPTHRDDPDSDLITRVFKRPATKPSPPR